MQTLAARAMGALEEAGVQLDLPADTARLLTLQTFFGAAALAIKDQSPPAELRARVTSKGGTTEAALLSFAASGIAEAVARGIAAAEARGRELGDILGRDEC